MFKKKWVKVVTVIVGIALCIFLFFVIANAITLKRLVNYIDSFEPIAYSEDRIVPVMEDGHYTITTDRDLRIMHITDIHIGGGFWSRQNDMKTVYELITMLQKEAPDIAILGGDNTYCVPGFGYNGGFTANNRAVCKALIEIFEHEQVYFTTVFGNHDTESFDVANRQEVGDIYSDPQYNYCFFNPEFTDANAETVPSVTNQFVVIKNTDGKINKLIMLIDSNAYIDTHFITSAKGMYDVIHDAQIEWAKNTIEEFSASSANPNPGEMLKTWAFMHIPIGEYQTARLEIESGNPANTVAVSGLWDEKICYGGLKNEGAPEDQDRFFEVLCDDLGSVEAIFSGHDHVNNAVVSYKGVLLEYGYSLDNEAYGNKIMYSGLQRGATVITLSPDGTYTLNQKNAYLDYGCDLDKYVDVYLDNYLYPDGVSQAVR